MGCGLSTTSTIKSTSGGQSEYHSKYEKIKKLGKGQFGSVTLVQEKVNGVLRAAKAIKKGITIEDNTVYSPMDKEMLIHEVEILRILDGKHFNMKLYEVYESFTTIWLVTECCDGDDMIHWTSRHASELQWNEISRIFFQLTDAVRFCHQNKIMHRDIKPENIMFAKDDINSELRLIDFGCGVLDEPAQVSTYHHTFAGSPFYNSPEMYTKKYTAKTDVWSIGVTMYVLVAGYPVNQLQEAFNILQNNGEKDLKNLPNMPQNLPESFYITLNDMLTHSVERRKSTEELLTCDFAQLFNHKTQPEKGSGKECLDDDLRKSLYQHSNHVVYKKFEIMVTMILASVLSSNDREELLNKISADEKDDSNDYEEKKLGIVTIENMVRILHSLGKLESCNDIETLVDYSIYKSFPYHLKLLSALKQHSGQDSEEKIKKSASLRGDLLKKKSRIFSIPKGISSRF